jgi:protein required for attachment to host cells
MMTTITAGRPTTCTEKGCKEPTAYSIGGERAYCRGHGPNRSHCPTCHGTDRWVDLDGRGVCTTCTPEPPAAAEIRTLVSASLVQTDGAHEIRRQLLEIADAIEQAEADEATSEAVLTAARGLEATVTRELKNRRSAIDEDHQTREERSRRQDEHEETSRALDEVREEQIRPALIARNEAAKHRSDLLALARYRVGQLRDAERDATVVKPPTMLQRVLGRMSAAVGG